MSFPGTPTRESEVITLNIDDMVPFDKPTKKLVDITYQDISQSVTEIPKPTQLDTEYAEVIQIVYRY